MDVLRDAGVNAQAKDAAASLNDALSATVAMIGNEVGQRFGRNDRTAATTSAADDGGQTVDQLLENAEGGVEASLLDAPDAEPEPPT
jgi:hypothetical protein